MEKDKSILIVGGAGTFGLSTAWFLAKSGYKDIKCFDRWPVPSYSSAGYDMNKIVRTEYASSLYTKLAHEALHLWRDPMFRDAFQETGWIFGTDGTTELGRVQAYDKSVQNTKEFGDCRKLTEFPNWDSLASEFPFLTHDDGGSSLRPNFRAIFNGNAGWVDPVKAMEVIKNECVSLGVKFFWGSEGTVVSLLREDTGKVIGVQTENGHERPGELVVLAAGAYSDTLLDFEGQLEATAYAVTHIHMTEDQYNRYRQMPVINISRRGYLFPPKEDRIFKVCNTDLSYIVSRDPSTRIAGWGALSTPRDPAYHPTDTQPTLSYQVTQRFLRYVLPELAEVDVHSSRLCWDAEAFDQNWIIGRHPSSPESLYIATGGSGVSFKNIVHVGKFVLELMEGVLDESLREAWRWRPDRIGASPEKEERSRRPKMELWEATGWNHDSES